MFNQKMQGCKVLNTIFTMNMTHLRREFNQFFILKLQSTALHS